MKIGKLYKATRDVMGRNWFCKDDVIMPVFLEGDILYPDRARRLRYISKDGEVKEVALYYEEIRDWFEEL